MRPSFGADEKNFGFLVPSQQVGANVSARIGLCPLLSNAASDRGRRLCSGVPLLLTRVVFGEGDTSVHTAQSMSRNAGRSYLMCIIFEPLGYDSVVQSLTLGTIFQPLGKCFSRVNAVAARPSYFTLRPSSMLCVVLSGEIVHYAARGCLHHACW